MLLISLILYIFAGNLNLRIPVMDKIYIRFMVLKSDDIEPLYFNLDIFRSKINFMVNLYRLFTIFKGSFCA